MQTGTEAVQPAAVHWSADGTTVFHYGDRFDHSANLCQLPRLAGSHQCHCRTEDLCHCHGPVESLGITMATFCGQNLGAKKFYRIRDGIRLSMYVSMCYCAFCIAFLWILGKYTSYLFLDPSETEVIRLAVQYMRLNAIFYPVLGVLFILRNSLQGMGYSLMPMMAGVSELAARSLVCFGFVPTFGYMAAVMASPVAWIFADVLLITVYFVDMRKLKRQLLPAEAAVPA